MKKFVCSKCKTVGNSGLEATSEKTFVVAPWYRDENQLNHTCVYCRNCGTIHDVVGEGCLLGIFSMLIGRAPLQKRGIIHIKELMDNLKAEGLSIHRELPANVVEALRQDSFIE